MFKEKLFTLAKDVTQNTQMKNHTTFKIGGTADYIVQPYSTDEICSVLSLCREYSVPVFVMGNGSNLLVGDKGIRGVVLKIGKNMSDISVNDTQICAQAGALLSSVASEALKASLTGLEFASGIPGTLGGAVLMNAGAYGGEMKDVVTEVSYIDDDLTLHTTQDFDFSYRHSIFEGTNRIITEVKMTLKKGLAQDIKAEMDRLASARRDKQPLTLPSAGSTFKRPVGGYAAQMIDETGLRGFTVGGASVSEKHAGFVVNTNDATADDVISLMAEVRSRVYEKFGVNLVPEVKMVGEFTKDWSNL